MRSRILGCLILFFCVASLSAVPSRSDLAAAAPAPVAHPCGTAMSSSRVVQDPPEVEMWKAPVDASGEHELILAVHHDGEAYCYHYTWNGVVHVASPTIVVKRGERFAIRIVNDIGSQSRGESVASTAILPCAPVKMPMPVTLHWVGYLNHVVSDRVMPITDSDTNLHLHGFEGPAAEENVFLSTLSTPMHACEYRITIPSTQPPGMYLYHPHAHGSADDTVAGGLDGAWIVEPDTPQIASSDEHVLVLRYAIPVVLDNNYAPDESLITSVAEAHAGSLPHASPIPYDPFDPPPFPVSYPENFGRVHTDPSGCNGLASEALIAVNGAETPATLSVPGGRVQLLRILNGTSDSGKLIRLRDASGAPRDLDVVGVDGVPVSGSMARPLSGYIAMREMMLSPMSRADVLVKLAPGETDVLSSESYCQGSDGFYEMHHDLVRIVASAGDASAPSVPRVSSAPVNLAHTPAARLLAFVRAHPTLVHRRAITFTEYAFPRHGTIRAHEAFFITDTTNPNFREHSFWPTYAKGAVFPSNPDIVVKQGTIEEWYIINATLETHAFHIHQMAFVQEKSLEGMPLTVDTVFIPVGHSIPNRRDPNFPLVVPSITRIIIDFRHVPKGEFPFHCHMLFHEDRGMMGVIRVE